MNVPKKTEELKKLCPKISVFGSMKDLYTEAYQAGIIRLPEYTEARDYYASLWTYKGE